MTGLLQKTNALINGGTRWIKKWRDFYEKHKLNLIRVSALLTCSLFILCTIIIIWFEPTDIYAQWKWPYWLLILITLTLFKIGHDMLSRC